MEYLPRANKQLKRFNDTVFSILRHFAANRQQDCNNYVLPFTYAYSAQKHREMRAGLLCLVFSRQTPALVTSTAGPKPLDI